MSEEKLETGKEANVLEKEKIKNKTDVLNKGIIERERTMVPQERCRKEKQS